MKKGFTLIELLAVILILGIVVVIAVPVIGNIVEDSRKKAAEVTANTYLDALTNQVVSKMLDFDGNNDIKDGTYDISELKVKIKGEKPTEGTVTIEKGKIKIANLVVDGYTISCDAKGICETQKNNEVLSGAYDENGNLVASWNQLVNDYGMNINWCANNECDVYYITQEEIEVFGEEYGITTPGWYSWNETEGAIMVNEPSVEYEYYSQEKIDKWSMYSDGVTTPGWYYYDKEEDSYIGVDINTINSNKPSIVLGKLGATRLVIDKSVKVIPKLAFSDGQLTSVIIPNSVTTIGSAAFQYNQLIDLVIPSSVTTIAEQAFQGNLLTSVEIPNSLTIIASQVFWGNELTSLEIPNSVTSIGGGAFCGSNLTSLVIPDSVKHISSYAFQENPLTSVVFNNSNNWYLAEERYNQNDEPYYENATLLDVSNPQQNATNISLKCAGYAWLTGDQLDNSNNSSGEDKE